MIRMIAGRLLDSQERILAISHDNCLDRVCMGKEKMEKLAKFKKNIIINTAGVSSIYVNDGGVIMVV